MELLKRLIVFLFGRLPALRFFSPIWKPLVLNLIQVQGDILQTVLIEQLALHGPIIIDKNINKWKADIKKALDIIPMPEIIRLKIIYLLDTHAAKIQENLEYALNTKGLPGLALVFNQAQFMLMQSMREL